MDIIGNFIDAINSHCDNEEIKESFVGFAKDAQSDPDKMTALNNFIGKYMRSDGHFDPLMYENPSYALLDAYDEVLSSKK